MCVSGEKEGKWWKDEKRKKAPALTIDVVSN